MAFEQEGWSLFESIDQIKDWFRDLTRDSSPPSFRTVPPSELPHPERIMSLMDVPLEGGPELNRRPDSGTLEVFFGSPERSTFGFDVMREDVGDLSALGALTLFEDHDRSARSVHPTSMVVVAQLLTQLDDVATQVIGPGGRSTMYRAPGGAVADIVVRQRMSAETGRWRDPSVLLQTIAVDESEMFRVTFGHFELSKFELQEFMRPAILIVAEPRDDTEGGSWRHAWVEPATTSDDRSLQDGLGSWV